MSNVTSSGLPEKSAQSVPSTRETGETTALRKGRIGTWGLVVSVAGVQVPLGSVVSIVPISIAFGAGLGSPGAWLIGGLIMLVFAVGWSRMSRFVTNAGAFYAYIGRALGIPMGTGSAVVATISYNATALAAVAIMSQVVSSIVAEMTGITLHWTLYVAVALVVILLVAYRGVDLSVRVLYVAVVIELLIIGALVVAIVANEGMAAFTLDVFLPANVLVPGVGLSIALAIWVSIGFEAAAVFGEEAKDPKRTVARASYLSIAMITAIYAISSWAIIAGLGADMAVGIAQENPVELVFRLFEKYFGVGFTNFVRIWTIFSILAACLACHNLATRYLYVLGRERIFPVWLGRVHTRTRAPWRAAVVQVVLMAIVIGMFALAGTDPYLALGSGLIGLSVVGIVSLMAVASIAIIVFFRTEQRGKGSVLSTIVAPIVSFIGMVFVIYLILTNYGDLSGYSDGLMTWMPAVIPLVAIVTILWTLALRRRDPQRYVAMAAQLDRE